MDFLGILSEFFWCCLLVVLENCLFCCLLWWWVGLVVMIVMEFFDLFCSVFLLLIVKFCFVCQLLFFIFLFLLMFGFGYGGYWVSESVGICVFVENGECQLELYVCMVESEISKYIYLFSLLELECSVSYLFIDLMLFWCNQVNVYFEGFNCCVGSCVVYLLDINGWVLVISNWSDLDSYFGEDLLFCVYWQDVMKGKLGCFYGIGSICGELGYYLVYGLVYGGWIIGVVVVKVKMDVFEECWEKVCLEVFVSDENGIIIFFSNFVLCLKVVCFLSVDDKECLVCSMQYYWWVLNEW